MSTLERPLHIDIPVKLAEVKVAFSVPALAFEGDLPASIFHLQLIENDIADWNANAQVIAVFHTNAGHVTLNAVCALSCVARRRRFTTGETKTYFPESRSTRMPWRG
jgi:hypothetical protein